MRVVLDTNIIVSAILSPGGDCASLVDAAIGEEIVLITCRDLSSEYRTALGRPRVSKRHGLNGEELDRLIELLTVHSLVVEIPNPVPRRVSDIDDDKVVACAIAGDSHYIVSGDNHLLKAAAYDQIRVVHPKSMLELLEEQR